MIKIIKYDRVFKTDSVPTEQKLVITATNFQAICIVRHNFLCIKEDTGGEVFR